ncbi:XapX domain-containing protein [Trinickia dabaoshanensis]|uniref:XapX domain-containing protein n=1 Tax=Trinickia dabaoshanensis TaxID=564714 RepID=A0A2N7VX87_9BURK|nr:XapX domain-containing protein [Trinickia dabaoshanensis]PMS21748.1 XapX domain-containing protein [Trinickia dabaoshanensis]
MKPYILSLLAGVLAGVVYYAIGVQTPAPPAVALVGLLGMLAGEQIIPLAGRMWAGLKPGAAWREAKCSRHIFGALPSSEAPNASSERRRV